MSMPETETQRRAVAIAAALAAASPGDKAEARRMGPAGSALFWRQVARLGVSHAHEADWRLFTRLVALMTPASREETIHETGRHLGAVLVDGGDRAKALNVPDAKPFLSEHRFARFLAARGAARGDHLERMIRMLARRGVTMDVVTLAHAVIGWSDDRLAAAYYKRIDQSLTKEPHDD
jgi:CRISPR system Cascade subunit CasB